MNVKKLVFWLGLAALVAIVVVWELTPLVLPAGNPPARQAGVIVSERSDAILRRACFDCHSNETEWPWYAVAPVAGLLVRYDVFAGRRELNLSEWSTTAGRRQQRKLREVVEEVGKGDMPPWYFLPLHAEARLTAADVEILRRDITALTGADGKVEAKGKRRDQAAHRDEREERGGTEPAKAPRAERAERH
jgi:hypothetical protein